MKKLLRLFALLIFSSCSLFQKQSSVKKPSLGTPEAIVMSRKEPSTDCEAVGTLRGTYIGLKPNLKAALHELRMKAHDKGGNYVRVDASSDGDTVVEGMAFKCPEKFE